MNYSRFKLRLKQAGVIFLLVLFVVWVVVALVDTVFGATPAQTPQGQFYYFETSQYNGTVVLQLEDSIYITLPSSYPNMTCESVQTTDKNGAIRGSIQVLYLKPNFRYNVQCTDSIVDAKDFLRFFGRLYR